MGPGPCDVLVGSYDIVPKTPGEYYITAIFELMGKEVRSATVKIGVVKVEIETPQGSYVETSPYDMNRYDKFPKASITMYPLRYDFQGVVDGTKGLYSIDIKGNVLSIPQYLYKWTLQPGAGKLLDPSSETPGHSEPLIPGDGILTLTALDPSVQDSKDNFKDTGVSVTRRLVVYQDHLQRDFENFNGYRWDKVYMGKGANPITQRLVCHQSVMHAYNGTYAVNMPYEFELWWHKVYPANELHSCEEFIIEHSSGMLTLDRGDVIGYYDVKDSTIDPIKKDSKIKHSSTMKDLFFTWGSNNEVVFKWMDYLDYGHYASITPEEYCSTSQVAHNKTFYIQIFRRPE